MTTPQKKTIVVVEDEPAITDLIAHILTEADIDVITCNTGHKGLATIFDVKPNMIILDIMLPGISGWEIYDQVREDVELKDTPVLVLSVTSKEAFEQRETFRGSEIDAFMSKPFEMVTLKRVVREMIGA